MKTRIQNAQVVFPDQTCAVDIILEDSKIADIDPGAGVSTDETIDASGLHLMAGVVDDQVHFREPGLTHKEDIYHASRACAKGGVTTYLEMPNTIPNAITQQGIDDKIAIAEKQSLVNFGFYIGATPDNIEDLKNAKRTPGIKIFIGSSTGNLLVDQQESLERIFAETTLPITAHCEDETIVRRNAEKYKHSKDIRDHSRVRDHEAAIVATRRAIDLAERHQHHFHVLHVSTGAEADFIAQKNSPYVSAEVCVHHLFFNVDDYPRLGSRIKMNPSIKDAADNDRLWQALLDNEITVVATDHAPHTKEEKFALYPECPSGLPAVENSLALMLNQVHLGRCTLQQVTNWMSKSPSEIWKIRNKGSIAVGNDADLCLVDLNRENKILDENQVTKCQWTPWHGETLMGQVTQTLVLGETVYQLDQEDPFRKGFSGSPAEFGDA